MGRIRGGAAYLGHRNIQPTVRYTELLTVMRIARVMHAMQRNP
jgi:hypothetical protein